MTKAKLAQSLIDPKISEGFLEPAMPDLFHSPHLFQSHEALVYADPLSLAWLVRKKAGRNKRIVFVYGNFNVLHPGHLRLLKFAAEIGDYLLVGLNPDDSPGVTVPAPLRLEGMQSIAIVNHAFILEAPLHSFLSALKPEFVVKGKEFEERHNQELALIESYGGKMLFSSGEVRFSASMLLQKEYARPDLSTLSLSLDFPKRHGFSLKSLAKNLSLLNGIRALVIGDLIIDDYIACDPIGMSQEDPTIVVTPLDTKSFVGGAGVVAAHARGLGAEVQFCTVVGRDARGDFALENLEAQGINVQMVADESRPTTVKQRFRALDKTLLRVNHLRQHPISHEIAERILKLVEDKIKTTDVILFSDFNYGCLPQNLVDAITDQAVMHRVPMAADSQASSQLSDISRFRGMMLITPTEREVRLALQDFESGLAVISENLQAKSNAQSLAITLGAEGLLVRGHSGREIVTDRLAAFNTIPKDVAGAGDSLFTCAALSMRAGMSLWESVYLGSVAAGAQVARVGNSPLSRRDLIEELERPLAFGNWGA